MNFADLKLTKQHQILIAIFFILVVYVDVSYILKAQRDGLNRLRPKITKLKSELKNLDQGLENMRLAKNQPSASEQKQSPRSSRIVPESKAIELLHEVSSLANKYDIQVTQLRPSRASQKGKPASGPGKDTPGVLLINLDLVGDYHSLGRFMQAVEESSVFMGVAEFEIIAQLPDYLKQKITLVLKTYVTK